MDWVVLVIELWRKPNVACYGLTAWVAEFWCIPVKFELVNHKFVDCDVNLPHYVVCKISYSSVNAQYCEQVLVFEPIAAWTASSKREHLSF